MTADTLSIIVPTVGRVEALSGALRSLVEQTVPAEIIVVEQNGDGLPGLAKVREAFGASCVWVRTPTRNLPAARNIGARLARGSILVFCDDDIEAPPTYLASLLERYADPRWGAVCGPSIASAASWNARPPVRDVASDTAFWRGNFQSSVSMEVRSGMGCNHSMRAHWWHAAGGYDESFTGGALREESEMFVRLARLGCRVYYDAACWLYHPRGERTGGCAEAFAAASVRERFRARLAAHAYFLYKSFPERAARHMRRELLDLFLRREGLSTLAADPRVLLDWLRIDRATARRFREPPPRPSSVSA